MRNTFKAYERLKREQHIDTLFRHGKAFSILPVKLIYHTISRAEAEPSPVRVGFSVPKKKFKKATSRNRIKRLLREAWRLNKASLYGTIPVDKQLHLFILFTGTAEPTFEEVSAVVVKGIAHLQKQF